MAGEHNSISKTILWGSVRLFVNAILVLILVEALVYSYHFSYKLFADYPFKAASSEEMSITIETGMSAKTVAVILDENNIVDGKYLFLARVYLGKYNSKIKAGTYTLGPGMSPEEICQEICGLQSEDAT